jgi:threonyl-tRNA synthetase
MRILQLHVDYIEYTPVKEEIEDAESIDEKQKKRLEDIVVILLSVEEGDENLAIEGFLEETKKYLHTIKCNSVLLYPYAHLSSNLENPKKAMKFLSRIEKELRMKLEDSTFKVYRAPFGWTKQLELRIKGHPMAENSKTFDRVFDIKPLLENKENNSLVREQDDHDHGVMSQALSAEKTLESNWFVLEPSGLLTKYEDYKFKKTENNLKNLFKYEIHKNRTVEEQPPHVKLMRKLGIADYEPASDPGNMRYYPKGRLLKSLLEQFVTRKVLEYGGLEVETPIMYDSHHPSMESYFNRFPARQYNIKSDQKELFLRFAACFGQFLMTKDFQISYKNLPLKLYELTRYSFRREKSGELVGLRRLRAFSMPDCHAFCKDLEQAKSEFDKRLDLSISVIEEIGLDINEDIEMAIRFTKEFYENNKQFVNSIVSKLGKPVMVEMWNDRFFYFTLKWEFNFLDNQGKASSLSTDQIDIENAERYDINYIDEDGNKRHPIILHNSPSGAIERVIFALLEKSALLNKEGKTSFLPLWLMNTQVRIIPVKSELIPFCETILNELKDHLIRCDLDDRDDSLSKKIREAETEWIHYIIIIGEKEVESNKVSVRDRMNKENYMIDNNSLIQLVKDKIKGKPYLPINLPEKLSKRPRIAS